MTDGLLIDVGGVLTTDIFPSFDAYLAREGVSAGTKRTERQALRAFFAWLVDEGLRDDDPSARLGVVKVPRGTPRPFTDAQIDAMLTGGAYRRTRAMILLGALQGLRAASIACVHGHDIDLVSGLIRVHGKGDKVRLLPLHDTIAELALTMPADDWWFPARRGREGHIHAASVTNLITRAKKRAGIIDERLTPHSLRHSFGTELVEHDVDIRVVQELMMHESLSTTQIYTGVSERRKRAGLDALPYRPVLEHSGRQRAA